MGPESGMKTKFAEADRRTDEGGRVQTDGQKNLKIYLNSKAKYHINLLNLIVTCQ